MKKLKTLTSTYTYQTRQSEGKTGGMYRTSFKFYVRKSDGWARDVEAQQLDFG